MSRDFELLQRLEQAQGRRSHLRSPLGDRTLIPREGPAPDVDQEPVIATHPAARLTAPVRNQLSRLVLSTFLSTPAPRVVMFTGVEAQEGASWIAACTAEILASASRDRVCIVDADITSPTLHRLFAIPDRLGLTAVMENTCSAAQAAVRVADNCWVLPAGSKSDTLQANAEVFKESMVEVLTLFDYIVISAPDCNRLAEVMVCGTAAEGAVLVLDAAKTRRMAAQQAKQALESARIRVIGSVLSNQDLAIPQFISSRL
jgi:Mrp family chromosome partitioning ATPase